MSYRLRRSARVLLFSPGGDLYLIHFAAELEGKPFLFWVTPGGEIEPTKKSSLQRKRELSGESASSLILHRFWSRDFLKLVITTN